MEQLTSPQNPRIKTLIRLQSSRRERREAGAFLAEGVKLCEEALAAGASLQSLYCTQEAMAHYPERLAPLLAAAGECFTLTPALSQKVSPAGSPQGVFGVCTLLDNRLEIATIKRDGSYLLAHSLQDPGNLGTIIRSCCAFGADGLILSEDCPDLYSPKVLRAAMGGAFRLPILTTSDMGETVAALLERGLPVYAAALTRGARPLTALPLEQGCGILIGNEGNGLPQSLIARCTGAAIIPMEPGTESLNAAMAAGIFLWECHRRRGEPK